MWGVAHILPAKKILEAYKPASRDNLLIVLMTWVSEGLGLIFIGVLVASVYALGKGNNAAAAGAIVISSLMLLIMALWSFLTGAKTSILPMKICPFVKIGVGVLFLLGVTI
jgi:hypothetical protein